MDPLDIWVNKRVLFPRALYLLNQAPFAGPPGVGRLSAGYQRNGGYRFQSQIMGNDVAAADCSHKVSKK